MFSSLRGRENAMPVSDNVDRLLAAGLLEEEGLTPEDRAVINEISLSDDEIAALSGIQTKLKLDKLDWSSLSGRKGIYRV
jgi:hypothetical protein